MARRTFTINEPFREIQQGDSIKVFESKLLTACESTLTSLSLDNQGDKHVWVYDVNDKILGVLVFIDRGTEFYVDVVSNNFTIAKSVLYETKPGGSLYQVMEDVAVANKVSKITLDSIPDRVSYWQTQFGFKLSDTPFAGKFCRLFPMEKKI